MKISVVNYTYTAENDTEEFKLKIRFAKSISLDIAVKLIIGGDFILYMMTN